ncbi:succinate dehydrogenase subunit B [Archaeoglobus sulfaticallidus PM70-1]|uniref:succinate dehydrogenase n=1 Tax=Archaeoglobus sulfaticallidus PM70-1 TaxID=387631 RepID=N0BIM5_9EURY|nr:succinate dehydrogenase iron-sulfur subunit [Archaeoglobus sulfaticallidus]AGK62172.1 succinate dehydrogenase subunit B [Archaeoglobus sulfaticallidus PM70-1]
MDVIFRIKRFDGEKSSWAEYVVPAEKGMTVLEGLYYIKENYDGSLAFRASCRMGICGSCAMKIDGTPKLACETQILSLGKSKITIEPLDNFKVIKDLVADFDSFFRKHEAVKPYLIRKKEDYENPVELIQKPEELYEYYDYSLCIKCGACYSVCPASATREDYLGPAAMAAAYRFNTDSRDEGKDIRMDIVCSDCGVWRCHFNAECSEVCPKNINPAKAVQKLRFQTAIYSIKKLFKW